MSLFILGTTAKVINKSIFEKDSRSLRSYFFKPYKVPEKFLVRTTSIVTDAPILGITSAVVALFAGLEFLRAIGNLVTGNFKDSLENLKGVGACLVMSAAFAVLATFSPIINTVDLVGGMVNSLRECCVSSEESAYTNSI
ncbi:hypothetical protein [Legionella cardiaca]|uniref:Integral membrane protein n=1 Tax=Legionella cardiaca TaxID=1071983 RepID=A0ABY8ARU4_9GAMM|nr:hypothetical protein [Legionella cardiaca]WED43253.1 hypothetical protein PXX05_00310 [Legionella cardiaca]